MQNKRIYVCLWFFSEQIKKNEIIPIFIPSFYNFNFAKKKNKIIGQ